MAEWAIDLPEVASEGATTHVADHNQIVDAIAEARTALDAVEALIAGKAATSHKHAAADVNSGVLDGARIPDLAQAKITGLTAALAGKQDSGDFAVTTHKHAAADVTSGTLDAARVPALAISKVTGLQTALDAKATAAALSELDARVAALELPAE